MHWLNFCLRLVLSAGAIKGIAALSLTPIQYIGPALVTSEHVIKLLGHRLRHAQTLHKPVSKSSILRLWWLLLLHKLLWHLLLLLLLTRNARGWSGRHHASESRSLWRSLELVEDLGLVVELRGCLGLGGGHHQGPRGLLLTRHHGDLLTRHHGHLLTRHSLHQAWHLLARKPIVREVHSQLCHWGWNIVWWRESLSLRPWGHHGGAGWGGEQSIQVIHLESQEAIFLKVTQGPERGKTRPQLCARCVSVSPYHNV